MMKIGKPTVGAVGVLALGFVANFCAETYSHGREPSTNSMIVAWGSEESNLHILENVTRTVPDRTIRGVLNASTLATAMATTHAPAGEISARG